MTNCKGKFIKRALNIMKVFDTAVQQLKHMVLKEIIKNEYDHHIENLYVDIPKIISPGPKAHFRCCVYKERAIIQERIKLALGGDKNISSVIEVINIACDECPFGGIQVTDLCRGCLSHRCYESCPTGAISIVDRKCVIDKNKCIQCGKCVKACPYSAIVKAQRPCVASCKVKAITVDEIDSKAVINYDKCVECGACVNTCPFGAIVDKSFVLETINLLKESEKGNGKVYAIVAPTIASQFGPATVEQVVAGIKKLGFYRVEEAAQGADITLYHELKEWQEKSVITTSCCPSFVQYIEKHHPTLKKYVSSTVSPMVEIAKLIKTIDKQAKCVFIGPCTSKKSEYKLEKTGGAIDGVISFEELQAFFDARDIVLTGLEGIELNDASYYGRIFARSGGISKGVVEVGKKYGVDAVKPVAMSGLEECNVNLLKLKLGKSEYNFFEGMACDGGCMNGALCLRHGMANAVEIENYGKEAKHKDIERSVDLYKNPRKEYK